MKSPSLVKFCLGYHSAEVTIPQFPIARCASQSWLFVVVTSYRRRSEIDFPQLHPLFQLFSAASNN